MGLRKSRGGHARPWASARARPFHLAPDATAKGRHAKPFIFQPKNKHAGILRYNSAARGAAAGGGEGNKADAGAAAAGTPGAGAPGSASPPQLARVPPGARGDAGPASGERCPALPTPAAKRAFRLLCPLLSPRRRLLGAEGRAREVAAARAAAPSACSPPTPGVGSGQGGGAGGAQRAPPAPPGRRGGGGRRYSPCLRRRGASGGRAGEPAGPCAPAPPVTQRQVPPAASASPGGAEERRRARCRLRAGLGRAMPPGTRVPSDLPSPPGRERLPPGPPLPRPAPAGQSGSPRGAKLHALARVSGARAGGRARRRGELCGGLPAAERCPLRARRWERHRGAPPNAGAAAAPSGGVQDAPWRCTVLCER